MATATVQHNPGLFPDRLILSLLEALAEETDGTRACDIRFRDQHSNDVAEIRFEDGRTLMAKRGRQPWAAARFATARRAAELLRRGTQVVAPRPLEVPSDLDERPLEVYWRIPLSTLKEVWPQIPAEERPRVMRSWGRVIQRLHEIELAGYGTLEQAACEQSSLGQFLEADLRERLLPAVRWEWPEAVGVIERLLAAVAAVEEEVGERRSTLLHNDLHMDNVLCEVEGESVRCVGVLDLEAAFAGPAEADLAHTQVLHGPLFFNGLPDPWFAHLCEGYGNPLNPVVMAFFRAYHLVNLGFYSAFTGHRDHAGDVAAAAYREVDGFDRLRSGGAAAGVRVFGIHLSAANA